MANLNMENLPKNVFDVKINTQAIFDTIMSERSSRRQGTHKVKNRAEVSGTGKKPWAQKGTGRARAGTLRSNVFVGGGVAFGPNVNRNYSLKVNKKVRKLAFNSALTLKAKEKGVLIEEFTMDKPSTKELLKFVEKLNLKKEQRKVLFITSSENIFRSANNLQNVFVSKLNSLSVEQIIHANVIIFSKNDIEQLSKGGK